MLQMEKLNSQKKFCIDESFKLKLTKICLPSGGGRRRINMYPFAKRKKTAHSIVSVNIGGNLCLPAALFLGKFRLTHDVGGAERNTWFNLIRKEHARLLEEKV